MIGIVLVSLPRDISAETTLTSVARVFVSMLVAFSYPLLVHPGRNSMLGLWRGMDSEDDMWLKHQTRRYVIVTVGY